MRWEGYAAPNGREASCMHGFGGETRGKENTWRTYVKMKYDIKMNLQ
jgi:hypothetical protein